MCGESYRRRYLEGEISPPGLAAVKGKSGHKVLELNNKQKIASRTDFPESHMKDIASDAVEEGFSEEVLLSGDERSVGISKLKAATKDELISSIPAIMDSAKLVQPVQVEALQEIHIPSVGKSIKYIMDVETEDGGIIDYKFTKAKKSKKDADTNLGLSTYALAYYAKHKEFPKGIALHNFVSGKSPRLNIVATDRTYLDFKIVLKRFETAITGIEAGVFTPANSGHWKCDPRYCGYYRSCPYINTERK